MQNSIQRQKPHKLLDQMLQLRKEVIQEGREIYARWQPRIERQDFRGGAENLAYYLALRQRDLTDLQEELNTWGLSALGRLESQVTATLDSIIVTLAQICDREDEIVDYPDLDYFKIGHRKLRQNAEELFGKRAPGQNTSIMASVDRRAAEDYDFVVKLLKAGANVLRINLAHGTYDEWMATAHNLREAERETGISCKLHVDIAGPKVRTTWLMVHENNNHLVKGDELLLSRHNQADGNLPYTMQVGLTLPEIIDNLEVGQTVLFDDGVIIARVKEVNESGAILKVRKTEKRKGNKLLSRKGINLPDTDLDLPILTSKDLQDLDFAVKQADIIGFSFIKEGTDLAYCIDEVERRWAELLTSGELIRDQAHSQISIQDLQSSEKVAKAKGHQEFPGIVAKIETTKGMINLADIIAEGAGRTNFGVMVARGDLAVESGFLALAEFQEQILWLCEAADTPSIWATDVLFNMVQNGLPTRAEVTDASQGGARSECVMLHSGEYLVEAIEFLELILRRMGKNLYKKAPLLPAVDFRSTKSTQENLEEE